ncbi:hypothetical protein OS493_010450 [Desmophyllum pertusum]|uniref:Uncharacterized protein n=1 Tax=Desmophyllum pertusum TaxID=174260 RepID=A0A9X0A3N8_9CNID|nr:hypothetical protein OS493_010450 [Desmophyllum pertusum]
MFKSRKGLEDNLSDTFYGNTCSPISKMERNKPLTTLMMGRLVKKSIAKAGFDEAQLSHRSYRSGFATRFIITCAIENGGRFETQQVEQLKRLGGWAEKSSVVHLYIKRIIEKYSDTCGLLNEGLRSSEEREERLRRIPSAYNYRLLPPNKNIGYEKEATNLFNDEYQAYLSKDKNLKKALEEEPVDPKKVNNSKQTATAKFCKEKNRRQHEERDREECSTVGPPKPQAAQLYGHIGIFTSGQEGGLFRGPLDSMGIKTIPNYRRGKAMATPLCCGHKHTDTNSK